MNSLQILAQHRDALLLAEAIGWLHDYRKCSDEHLKVTAANPGGQQALRRDALAGCRPCLSSANLQLPTPLNSRIIADLLDDRTWNSDLLGQFLSRCHNTAHFDKQEPIYGKQNHPGIQISSPFGFERDVGSDLTGKLWKLPWHLLCNSITPQRTTLQTSVCDLFSTTVADTRRPINEVGLWSWGLLVGALYKAALAGALLAGSTPAASDLRWRLLGIRVNGLDYLLGVVRIPDLLARQELLNDSLNKVRELLEVTYPLGSEVYRDENGSLFVVPDVPDLLNKTDGHGKELRSLILEAFAQGTVHSNHNLQLGGEMVPHIELEQQPWWGQDPNWPRSSNDELPNVGALLAQKVISAADTTKIKSYWPNNAVTDICTVCGLRPQGPGKKAAEHNVCDICEQRRADRSQKWATAQTDRTIWTDEVADANGRLALIVGQFDLTHWLDGSLLESLLLIAPHDPQNTKGKPVTSKTPSFSRLRRIWETTRTFWREVQDEQKLSDDRCRLKIYLDSTPNLAPFHVYDLLVGSTDLSVVWVPPQSGNSGYLLSADNLSYIARQLGAETDVYTHAVIFVKDYLKKQFNHNHQPVLLNPDASTGQGRTNLIAGIRITKVDYQYNRYATLIPILAEPRTFMMLIPADRSLEVVKHIKEKYEQELGKVRDRLPLFLGCIYAGRYTPIRAVLDAGRAMLAHRCSYALWCVTKAFKSNNAAAKDKYLDIELESSGYALNWKVPLKIKMGDGTTDDLWYPYFFLETDGDDSKADESKRRAVRVSGPASKGPLPSDWVVHAADLQPGETIYLWPSRFDFEFLDTTARRFEINYDANGRRPRRTRPFYLEDLDRLETLWSHMKHLTRTQRHQVIRTIEATREAWYGQDSDGKSTEDKVFRQFVADTLAGAGWPQNHSWKSIPEEWREKLVRAGARGELADLAELHMEILKE